MKILFYGHRGFIGSQIVEYWKRLYPDHVLELSDTRVDVKNEEQLAYEISRANRVFCTIGRTSGTDKDGNYIPNIDYLENNLKENINDNLYAPMLLAILCKRYGVPLAYLGTGCIFSRNTRENDYIYTEKDIPDFFQSSYSIVKGYTDNLMKLFPNTVINFRIRMPIVDITHEKNFITKISKFKYIYDMPNSMTYLPDIIPIMIGLTINGIVGTYNMVNQNPISHKEILDMYREIVDPNHTCEYIEEKDLDGLLKAKRSNNVLQPQRVYNVRDIKECVHEALINIKKNNEFINKINNLHC
jgi:3,5-epimerase/4-reductase